MPYDHDSDGRQVAVSFGRFTILPSERALQCDGQPVALGSRAFDVLLALLERPGEIVPHRTLIERAWPGLTVEEANLRVHIANLRRTLSEGMGSGNHIINVPGRGYAMTLPVRRGGRNLAISLPDSAPVASAPSRRLLGREADIARLSALVAERRLVSIVGPGGVGKTALARHLMQALADGFAGGTYYVDLAGASGSEDALALLHAALGVQANADALAAAGEFLRPRRALVVLDTCAHVIDAAATLSSWILSVSPGSHVLLCSREATRSAEESVHVLASLDTEAAVALFMASARSGGYALDLMEGEAAAVAAICARLDGNPLAIEIVASRAGTHGIRGTIALLDNPEWLLNQTLRGAPARHRTIATALDWSYDLLSARDRRVMGRLAALPDGFTMAAAEGAAGDDEISRCQVEAAISRLLEQSLLTASLVAGRMTYRFSNLTRIYAGSKFSETEGVTEIRIRHARAIQLPIGGRDEADMLGRRVLAAR